MPESLAWTTPTDNSFSVSGYSYDLNGNIRTFLRKGQKGSDLDSLYYRYGSGVAQSNQLLKVKDSGLKTEGFTEIVGEGLDYEYDNNGNLVWDKNKGGEEILQNGTFADGNIGWVVTDTESRLTFQDGNLNVATGTTSATMAQNDIILRRAVYVVIVDMVRQSGSISFNIGSAETSLSAPVGGQFSPTKQALETTLSSLSPPPFQERSTALK